MALKEYLLRSASARTEKRSSMPANTMTNEPRVLVVSSDEGVAHPLVVALRKRAVQASWAGGIESARELLQSWDADLVVSDWRLADGEILDLFAADRNLDVAELDHEPRWVVRLDAWTDSETLKKLSRAPFVGVVPRGAEINEVAHELAGLAAARALGERSKQVRAHLIERFEVLSQQLAIAMDRSTPRNVAQTWGMAHALREAAKSSGFPAAEDVASYVAAAVGDEGSESNWPMLIERVSAAIQGLNEGRSRTDRPALSETDTTPEPIDTIEDPDALDPAHRVLHRICAGCSIVWSGSVDRCGVCDAPLDTNDSEVIDGRYRRIEKIGEGSAGAVWKATDVALRREVALKFLLGGRFAGRSSVRRFQREAVALASVRHPHIADVYAFGVHGDSLYYAMEYIHGRPLRAIIEAHRTRERYVPVHRALVICRDVASGLSAVHGANIVHRDVKPENVIIERGSGRAVVVDFGLASPGEDSTAHQTGMRGTPAYMAPEQITGAEPITPRSDVYALGCTLFELLTNRLPFDIGTVGEMLAAHQLDTPPPLSELRSELEQFDPILERALSKKPEDRWESVAAMAAALWDVGRPWLGATPLAPRLGKDRASEELERPVELAGALKLLAVDDDLDFLELVHETAHVVFGGQVKILHASTGSEAVKIAKRNPPQLVVLDYRMPGIDGLETLSRLRALQEGASMRVMIASASADELDRARFDSLGVERFLQKPLDPRAFAVELGELGREIGWLTPA